MKYPYGMDESVYGPLPRHGYYASDKDGNPLYAYSPTLESPLPRYWVRYDRGKPVEFSPPVRGIAENKPQPSGNRKETSGKDPMGCVPLDALSGVAWVFRSGEVKYGVENWREKLPQGDDVRHYIGAAMRHLAACQHDHPALDKESGLHHLDHAIASLIIASYHMKKGDTK